MPQDISTTLLTRAGNVRAPKYDHLRTTMR